MGCDEQKAAWYPASAEHRRDVGLSHEVLWALLQGASYALAGCPPAPEQCAPMSGGTASMRRSERAVLQDLSLPVAIDV